MPQPCAAHPETSHEKSKCKVQASDEMSWTQTHSNVPSPKAWLALIRANPRVLIAPLLVLAACCAVGCALVHISARREAESMKEDAQNAAAQSAASIRMQLLGLIYPTVSMAAYIESGLGLNYTAISQVFPAIAEKLLSTQDRLNPHTQIQLAPQGTMTDVYPLNEFSRTGLGLDFLGIPTKRKDFQPDLGSRSVLLRGPTRFMEGYLGMVATSMVFMTGVDRDNNFSQPIPVSPYCTPDVCYQAATRSKFWGMVFGIVPLDAVLQLGVLDTLSGLKFNYVITQPAVYLDATPGFDDNVVLAQSDVPVADPVAARVDLSESFLDSRAAPNWTIYVSPAKGWSVTWEKPIYAVVVIISVALALLLLMLMVSRVENKMLLYSLVPEKMVKELKAMNLPAVPAKSAFALSTPAQVLLNVLTSCLMGILPSPTTCVQLRGALLSAQDLYRPDNLTEEIQAAELDEDVARNLIRTLQGKDTSAKGEWDALKTDVRSKLGSESIPSLAATDTQYEDLQMALTAIVSNTAVTQIGVGPGSLLKAAAAGKRSVCHSPGMAAYKPRLTDGTGSIVSSTHALPFTEAEESPTELMSSLMTVRNRRDKQSTALASLNGEDPHNLSTQNLVKLEAQSTHFDVTAPVYDALRGILDKGYTSWTFDSFALDAASNGHPLSSLMFYLVHETGLMHKLSLPPAKVASFVQALEALYLDNPYHNRVHAADVTQTMHVLLARGGFLQHYCDPIRHLACLLAAAAHDVEHVGLTNDYLINTDDWLTLRYNDRSPMENHHLATLFNLLKKPQHNFIGHLSKDVQRLLRKFTIELVLATDMTQHLTILSQFKSMHQSAPNSPGCKHDPQEHALGVGTVVSDSVPVPVDDKERLLSLQVVLKMADLGQLAEGREVHCRFVDGLTEEFYRQGNKEREAGLPITPLFDRTAHKGLPKSQVGFFNFVALPLFQAFTDKFKGAQPFLDQAMENYRYWKQVSARDQVTSPTITTTYSTVISAPSVPAPGPAKPPQLH